MPYPFVVTAGFVFPPDGFPILAGATPFRVTYCAIHADPEGPAATADTSFIIQNAPSSPTASGAVTILSGARSGSGNMNVPVSLGQKIYVKAPSALNGVQNLWIINFGLAAL